MSEWKYLSGIEEVTAARDAWMEIEVDILDEWRPWTGEFCGLLDQVWFKYLKFRARPRKPSVINTEAQTGENEVSEWHELNGIEEVAAAVAEGMEIQVQHEDTDWFLWPGLVWNANHVKYRARPRKPAKVLGKRICWTSTNGNLTWTNEDYQFYAKDWKRFPVGDLEGEVEA